IILLIDALRTKNLSLFGYEEENDRNLKKIASKSILFKQHFSTTNATAPAITSILTGLYPPSHGIIHQLPYTKKEEIDKVDHVNFWLPSYLKEKGYETMCIDWVGFWMKKGFDFYGENEDGSETLNRLFISARETIDLAINKIKKSNKPFFLLTHFWDTHFPFPNVDYKSNSNEEDRKETLESIKNKSQKDYLKKRIERTNLYTINDMINKYNLSIREIDKEIGRLFEFLLQTKLLDETIIFILGDHGDNLTDHETYFSPSGLFDDSIHVPMILHIPGIEKKQIKELTQHVDIMPTILELIGQKEEISEGKSMLSLIKKEESIREVILAFDGLCNNIKCARTKNKKLIMATDNFCNLCKSSHHKGIEEYDLEKDPDEEYNVFSGKSELSKFLEAYP
ncbi:MAG TPA: sulfatase, partial [Candidatus Nanoarchaeia archaeon]|nr:sulfatase [Candidatus Nanoarchaeia archaeon]